MSFAVRRAITFVLPLLILPAAAHAAPKVGTVTSSSSAVVAHNGKVVPATPNMPLFQGDKVMTLSNGSANVSLGNQSMHLGNSSMVPMDAHPAILTMNSGPSFQGGDRFRQEFLKKLAEFHRFIHDFRCHVKFPHLQQASFGGGFDFDDNDDDDGPGNHGNGNAFGHDKDHDHHGNPHCPPVSP